MWWDWNYAWSIVPELLRAIPITLAATLEGFVLACLLGLPMALAKRSQLRWLSWPVTAIAEFIRCTPLIIQLFFYYYALPSFGIVMSAMTTGVIGLGLHYSTYLAEVYRSGIDSVPRGQWEASRALNFSRGHTWLRIVLPQSVPPTIPVMGNYLIVMFKETPTLSAITLVELLTTAKNIGSQSFRYLEAFTLVGILFLIMSYPSAWLVRKLEVHLGRRERRAASHGR
ncbi:ectoine/hydroxyectoine ABC transporter permease subunit EhuD [Cohnella lubricantis]|uniref:Ectoine/hydroxyectoine ABC transporter permease subunit EhuD n=1 Tax=Cohnella lubricantis TaxID=2163172 RepID=A0A841T9N5_9BACL|nr:ectoine/hydroxyectoine ABC transporter permease subunit EhuD [Cohnella lubricantis]MBB6678223.1 ectoine/hydroxyectoine ABC transporter permease subunit EhuD [Cohnella lubricantis]MBP2120078.1 polar amino acid transport system permease protein [Cohnella lubricantis]